jgi:hypothetical protein
MSVTFQDRRSWLLSRKSCFLELPTQPMWIGKSTNLPPSFSSMSISQSLLLHVAYQEKSWFVAMRKVLVPVACTSFNIQNTGWMCHRPEGLVQSHQVWTAWWPVRIHVQQAAQLQYLVEFGICPFGRMKRAVPNPWLKGLQIHKCTLHNHFHHPETCHQTLMSPSKTLPSACCNPWSEHTGQIPTIEQQELNQNTFILFLHNPE